MEVPFNDIQKHEGTGQAHRTGCGLADQGRWVAEAYQRLEEAGYAITSTCTAVKNPDSTKFVYETAYGPELTWSHWELRPSGIWEGFTTRT